MFRSKAASSRAQEELREEPAANDDGYGDDNDDGEDGEDGERDREGIEWNEFNDVKMLYTFIDSF